MHQLWFTSLLNRAFATPTTALLNALHIPPVHAQAPITDPVAMEILVALVLIVVFAIVRASMSVESPGGLQHLLEGLHEMTDEQSRDTIGQHNQRYIPYLVALFLFILLCNLLGLIPGFVSPTQFIYVPLGMAISTWIYYHFHGVREQGIFHYIKHFCGPVWELPIVMLIFMAPLMFVIEIISHSARLMSLSVRLYANMFAGEMVTLAFFSLIPIAVPLLFMGLHLMVAFVQAFLFFVLTMIYLAGAVAAEEH